MTENDLKQAQEKIGLLKSEIQRVIVDYDEQISQMIIAFLAGGHILLEGVPGIGKTLLVKTLSQSVNLNFSRIQFTPDLMPADITGTNLIVEDATGKKHFQFQKGPVFSNVVLADEINRATPKTQSALLEAMQELTVTANAVKYRIDRPFIVVATQNPIEMEGTYPLPEAQLDRFFFKVSIPSPDLKELNEIIARTTAEKTPSVSAVISREEILTYQSLIKQIPISSGLVEYTNKLVLASHPDSAYSGPLVKQYVRYGASPRAAQALVIGAKTLSLMQNKPYVSPDNIVKLLLPTLRHRIILNIEGEAGNIPINEIIKEIKKQARPLDGETEKILSLGSPR